MKGSKHPRCRVETGKLWWHQGRGELRLMFPSMQPSFPPACPVQPHEVPESCRQKLLLGRTCQAILSKVTAAKPSQKEVQLKQHARERILIPYKANSQQPTSWSRSASVLTIRSLNSARWVSCTREESPALALRRGSISASLACSPSRAS